jgi:type I restriction enzyme S subunit
MRKNDTNNRNVPNLRFSGFGDEWEAKKLSELLDFKNGLNASKEDYGKGYKFINVLDIINNNFISHDNIIGLVDVSESDFNNNLVEYGDILFQRSSETRKEVGQANVYLDSEKPVTFGGFVIRGKKKAQYNPIFLNYLLKTDAARKEITSKSGGSTRFNISQETLSSVEVFLANPSEQFKIAEFIFKIEERIQTQSKIIEDYKLFKKGLTQKISKQLIKLKNKKGLNHVEWSEKKISEVFDVTRGYVLAVSKMKQIPDEEFCYPVYSSQTKDNGLTGFFNEYLYENAITWTTDGANAGKVKYRKGKFYCTNVCGVLISKEGYANECIAELLNLVTKRYVSYVGNPKLMNNIMRNIKIKFPSLKEQQKVAKILTTIDKKVELETKYLEQLTQQKKYFLQQLFI